MASWGGGKDVKSPEISEGAPEISEGGPEFWDDPPLTIIFVLTHL